jgi:sec-independent protein translocase protein TatA
MPFGIGIWELLVLLAVLLLVFGPKRLPDLGRQLGRGLRDFKDAVSTTDEPVLEPVSAESEPRA